MRASGFDNLKGIVRCSMHVGQKSLERAVEACDPVNDLVQGLIFAYAKKKGEPGGFARALTNSCRLSKVFADNVSSTDSVLKSAQLNFAAQRYNTIVDVAQCLVLNIEAVLTTLTEVHLSMPHLTKWSAQLLQLLHLENLILLAMVAELASLCSTYVHAFDNKVRGGLSHAANKAAAVYELRYHANKVFSFTSLTGEQQEPLALSDSYSAGFLQLLKSGYDMCVSKAGRGLSGSFVRRLRMIAVC